NPDAFLQIGQELLIRPPTATPEPTPTLTPTLTATPQSVSLAQAATPTPEPTTVAMVAPKATAAAESGGSNLGSVLGIGAMIAGVALTVLAGVAIMVMWRDDP
ncbi:MAG TPA: hypothetical protein PKE20_02330, partial [Promineifilum sp.]|nr:hypothetical protein [Promineifilum sp.]